MKFTFYRDHSHRFLLLIWVVVLFIVSGCSEQNVTDNHPTITVTPTKNIEYALAETITQELLAITDCNVPCWNGITVGQSLYSEVEPLLQQDPNFTVRGSGRSVSGRRFLELDRVYLSHEETPTTQYITFDLLPASEDANQVVRNIRFGGFPERTLEEWITSFGEPSHIFGYIDEVPNVGDTGIWTIRLLWLDKGIELHESGFLPEPAIDNHLLVGGQLTSFEPNWDAYHIAIHQTDMTPYLTEWKGYGEFEQYITDLGE